MKKKDKKIYEYCKICGFSLNVEKLQLFCSLNCYREYLKQNNVDFIDKDNKELKNELEKKANELERKECDRVIELNTEKKISYDNGYEVGYLQGYLDAEKQMKICPVCGTKKVDSVHHIIPRAYGGLTTYNNIICLCRECHDMVEMKTDDVLKMNRNTSAGVLRHYVMNGFPLLPVNEEPIEVVKRKESGYR